MKTKVMGIITVVLVFGAGVFGDIVELPLNCGGAYDINTSAWTSNFDLGVTFSEISQVYIDWSGEITAGLAEWEGKTRQASVGLDAVLLGAYPNIQVASILGGVSTYPAPEPFDVQTEFWLWKPGRWDNLLDGKETIAIKFCPFPIIFEEDVIYGGSVLLNDATLVVEGTIIPEPTTLLLFGTGLITVLARDRKKPKK